MVGDFRRRNLSLQVLFVCDLVNAHVGVVDICQQTDNSILLTEEPAVQFEFDIRGVGIAQVPNQMLSVRNLWQQRLSKAQSPLRALIFEDEPPGVTASVSRVVIPSVLVNGPIHELQMAVAANGVHIEEVSHAELAKAELKPAGRQFRKGRKRSAGVFDPLVTQRKYLVIHQPAE